MTNPQRTIAALIERWPQCFSAADPRPLAIGIFHDVRRAAPKIDSVDLSAALAAYVRTDDYLKAMTARRAVRVSFGWRAGRTRKQGGGGAGPADARGTPPMTRQDEPWKHRSPAWQPIDHSDFVNVHITTRHAGGWRLAVHGDGAGSRPLRLLRILRARRRA
jgi:hypothetical protein